MPTQPAEYLGAHPLAALLVCTGAAILAWLIVTGIASDLYRWTKGIPNDETQAHERDTVGLLVLVQTGAVARDLGTGEYRSGATDLSGVFCPCVLDVALEHEWIDAGDTGDAGLPSSTTTGAWAGTRSVTLTARGRHALARYDLGGAEGFHRYRLADRDERRNEATATATAGEA